jgi:hypothetical protein
VDQGQDQSQYLPAPPQSLEVGPNSPTPSPDATWSPGCWYWQDSRYVWRPGFWVPFQPDWVWVPAHYVWTPGGFLFVNGYWDRPFPQRGLAFAPVYYQQPIYTRPNYLYTPTVGLVASALASSLFVRPAYHQYYFGDYYAANNFNSGIYPWYSFHQSRFGYDPLFSHYAAVNTRRDPRWVENLHEEYRYRREHPEARPARTFAQQQTAISNINNVNVKNVTRLQNLVIARPLAQLASRTEPAAGKGSAVANAGLRLERIDEARRRAMVQKATQLQQFRQQRLQQERAAAKRTQEAAGKAAQARRLELPRSPLTGIPLNLQNRAERAERLRNALPPPAPAHPRADTNVRPPGAGNAQQLRHEPNMDQLPPFLRARQRLLQNQARPQNPNVLPKNAPPPLRKEAPQKKELPRRKGALPKNAPPPLRKEAPQKKKEAPPKKESEARH